MDQATGKQMEIIRRGVAEIVGEEELLAKLGRGKPLRIKYGVDPTTPDIHLGHTVLMRKLRQFQDLGHHVILLIGDYTATVGDPSGRAKGRPMLSHAQVLENARTYQEQCFKLLDRARTEVVYNGDWLGKLSFQDTLALMSKITVAQMLEREDFKKRYEGGQPIGLHEFMYPMMQGYDSVAVRADVELGGTDQKFNVLRGRELQRDGGLEPQVGIFLPILLGVDGKEKMSKSLGNYIGVDESPQAMYHKLYSLADSLVESYFELLTDAPVAEVREKAAAARGGRLDPNAWKRELALDIVGRYHGREAAAEAAEKERKIHAGEAIPEDAPALELPAGEYVLLDLLVKAGLAQSNGEARRLVQNGGISFDDARQADPKAKLALAGEHVLRAGKRNFVRLIAK